MSLPLAASIVVLVATLTNRILAMAVGLWLQIPAVFLLVMLCALDVIQIPFFYRLYEHGFSLLDDVPVLKNLTRRDWSKSSVNKWAAHLGGLGVMLVAAMPTFGGGMWSATFLAYGMRLDRRAGYAWMVLGSLLSYFTLFWILDTLIRTLRYFVH